ncbi:MAG: phospholipid carrier-dependent glycosyltransferase [Caldilineaceae bacterium]
MKWNQRDWYLLLAITLIGAILRLYKLGVVPPGLQFDEAFNAIDAEQVLAGNRPLFLPANAGREVLYTYWQAAIAWLAGNITPYTLRLASALAGILCVVAAYLLIRSLCHRHSRTLAAFTSLTLALSLWNVHFSHFGIRVIMMPMILSAAFGTYWAAGQQMRRARRVGLFCLSGVLVGISVWTHPTGRLVPFVLIGFVLWQFVHMQASQRVGWKNPLAHPFAGLLIAGATAFLVFLPLGFEFYRRPDFFFEHAAEAFVFNEQVGAYSPWRAILQQTIQVIGMFNVRGDLDWTHNVPGRPVFDPLMSVPFVIGLVIWVQRIRNVDDPDRSALVLLGMWSMVMLLPSILSNDAPDFSRTLPTHPALFVSTGLGLTWMWTRAQLFNTRMYQWLGAAVVSLVIVVSGGWTMYDYFVEFPQHRELYYIYDVDKQDALNYLHPLAADHQVYLSQLWAGHASVAFLLGDYGFKSLDTSDTIVLPPSGAGAIYAFPAEQHDRAEFMATVLHTGPVQTEVDPYGKQLLNVVQADAPFLDHWPADLAPQQINQANFEDAPTLLGLSTNRLGQSDPYALTIYWRADVPTTRDLTSFVHLIDADGNRVGQIDKAPGNGSYRTPYWAVGERVLDVYYPDVSEPCASGETVRAVVGWYELAANGLRRPRLDTFGDTALAGEMPLPVRAYPHAELTPAVRLESQEQASSGVALNLWGYTLHGSELQAGAPMTLDLFWHKSLTGANDRTSPAIEARLLLQGNANETNIWNGVVSQPPDWRMDEAFCQRLRLRLPNEISAGRYELNLTTTDAVSHSEAESALGSIALQPSLRNFSLPTPLTPANALFGSLVGKSEIALAGVQIGEQSPTEYTLPVTLVWQAQTAPLASYTTFVHLVDRQGQIVSQSDALPAGGYTTNQWAPGEVVLDPHQLKLPDDLASGTYTLIVGLYDALSGQRLWAIDDAGQALQDNAAQVTKVELH